MELSCSICVHEMVSTYSTRYADRAKKIKNKAVVNENPMDKLIRELKEENEKLKKSLQGGGVPEVGGGALSAEGASICLQAFWTRMIG